MNWLTLTALAVAFTSLTPCHGAAGIFKDQQKCPARFLKGGRVRPRSRGRIVKYVCLRGYQVLGAKYSICIRGKWDTPMPVCINGGCLPIDVPHGQVLETYRGALVTVHCDPGFSLVGTQSLYCNGAVWNDTAPICREIKTRAQKVCDFESEELCGWSHDLNHDFDWRRHNFATPSGRVGTGPSFDHTLGPGLNGHYMYLETSSPRLENDTARLFSPIFSAPGNPNSCFIFWYHMYGLSTGSLNVYLHNQDTDLMFSKSGDQGDEWREAIMPLPHVTSNFQIVIEGVRGTSYEGDIAIDDVRLAEGEECMAASTPITEESSQMPDDASCDGRCFSVPADPANCECTNDCISNNTCCPDYLQTCFVTTTALVTSQLDETQSSFPSETATTETQAMVNTSQPGNIASTTTKSEVGFSASNNIYLDNKSTVAETPLDPIVQPTPTVVKSSKPPLLEGTEWSVNTMTMKPIDFSNGKTQSTSAKVTMLTIPPTSTTEQKLASTTTSRFRDVTPTLFVLFSDKTSSAVPTTVRSLQPLTPKVVNKTTGVDKRKRLTSVPSSKKTTVPYQNKVPLTLSTRQPLLYTRVTRPKLEFITPPPPVVFWAPKTTANKQVTRQQQKINTTQLATSTLNPKVLKNSTKGIAKSKNDVLHPVWNKESVSDPVQLIPTPIHRTTTPPVTETIRLFKVTMRTATRLTSTVSTLTTSESNWNHKYNSKDQTPVHAPIRRPSSHNMMNIIALISVVLFILSVVLATVCVVRRSRINRRSIEDDELDIQFLAQDEILDFTLARPSQDDTGICETMR